MPFFLLPVRRFVSFVVAFMFAKPALSLDLAVPFETFERFKGVRGVSVVWGAGGSLLTLCTPATTEAAEIGPEATGPTLLREICAADPIGTFGRPVVAPAEADRAIVVGTGKVAAETAFAAAIVGNAVVEFTDAERAVAVPGGGGTSGGVGLAGSSNVGGGNTGLVAARPVPEGPPPPVLRRGALPAAPLAALRAC